MILIYVASPYSRGNVEENLVKHKLAGNELINNGYAVVLPLLFHYQHELFPQDYMKWLELDIELMLRCDSVLRLDGVSEGADEEERIAKAHNIPVFYSLHELNEYWNG